MTKRNKFGLAPGALALVVIIIAIAAILGVSVSGWAQTSPYVIAASVDSSSSGAFPATNAADDPILTITKRVDEVNVLFIATDRRGKFVRNLNQADFTILDDHKTPQAIINFRRATDL